MFRRLARVMHPDVAGNGTEVALRFRFLVEAYNVVSAGRGQAALDAALRDTSRAKGQDEAADAPGIRTLRVAKRFDAWSPGVVGDGDVVLFKIRDSDLEEWGLPPTGLLRWGLAVVAAQQVRYTIGEPCGFIYGHRLIFENALGPARERRGTLITDDQADMVLIDPQEELEVIPAWVSPRDADQSGSDADVADMDLSELRYMLAYPVDTRHVYTDARQPAPS